MTRILDNGWKVEGDREDLDQLTGRVIFGFSEPPCDWEECWEDGTWIFKDGCLPLFAGPEDDLRDGTGPYLSEVNTCSGYFCGLFGDPSEMDGEANRHEIGKEAFPEGFTREQAVELIRKRLVEAGCVEVTPS